MKPLDPFHMEINKGCITFIKARRKYRVYQNIDRKRVRVGDYDTYREAVTVYNAAQIKEFGQNARLKHLEKVE